MKRMVVGSGSGNTQLITAVEGFRMTSPGLRLLGGGTVNSGGSKTPGVILPLAVMAATSNPIGLVVGGTVKVAQEASGSATLEGAAKRTADQLDSNGQKARLDSIPLMLVWRYNAVSPSPDSDIVRWRSR